MSPLTEPTKLTLAKTYVGIDDPDAANYIALVEAADTAAGSPGGLETATKVAIHSFVKGCKADGIWPAIKASCILAGARTRQGALVPLVKQPADSNPTFNGTAGGWNYNRKTGLAGNGTDNYINSNRAAEAQGQDNIHLSAYSSSAGVLLGRGGGDPGATLVTEFNGRLRNQTAVNYPITTTAPCFIGGNRSGSLVTIRNQAGSTSTTQASETTLSGNIIVLATTTGLGAIQLISTGRIAFYSIGESLNLALLDARVTALITAFGAAIP